MPFVPSGAESLLHNPAAATGRGMGPNGTDGNQRRMTMTTRLRATALAACTLLAANHAAADGLRVANCVIEPHMVTDVSSLVDGIIDRWFTAAGQERLQVEVTKVREMILNTPVDGFCACCEAIRDMDQRESLRDVSTRSLVMVGEQDMGTPVSAAEFINERIAASTSPSVTAWCRSMLTNPMNGASSASKSPTSSSCSFDRA